MIQENNDIEFMNKDLQIYEEMEKMQNKLNNDLGYQWWRKYVSGAFWSNISTPINLSITILTAIMSGQATTNNLIPNSLYVKISIASLLLSTLNTFFKPHSQMSQNIEMMKTWYDFGIEFEKIYYSKLTDIEDCKRRLDEYTKLSIEINKTKNSESPETQNFITDLINYISILTCLKNKNSWLEMDREVIKKYHNDKKDHDHVMQHIVRSRANSFLRPVSSYPSLNADYIEAHSVQHKIKIDEDSNSSNDDSINYKKKSKIVVNNIRVNTDEIKNNDNEEIGLSNVV